jgi:hypothetical protein
MSVNVAQITISKEELKRLMHILIEWPEDEAPDHFVLYVKPESVNFREWHKHPNQLIDAAEPQLAS